MHASGQAAERRARATRGCVCARAQPWAAHPRLVTPVFASAETTGSQETRGPGIGGQCCIRRTVKVKTRGATEGGMY